MDALMDTLMDSTSGRYWLKTWSGTRYLIDLNLGQLSRFPHEVHASPDIALWLRSDQTPIALLHIADCTVGRPGQFIIDLQVPDVPFTVRTTTTVVSIVGVSTAEPDGSRANS